jgi:hypothetical protein
MAIAGRGRSSGRARGRADAEEALGLALERSGRLGPADEAHDRALALCEAKGILPRAERPPAGRHP